MQTGIYDKYQVIRMTDGEALPSGTFFILKQGDVLATAALRSYAGNCLMLLETHRAMMKSGQGGFLSVVEQEHLKRLASDAMWTADEWEGHNQAKLPD